jgi:minor extracellular serine protease Vpr
MEEIQALPEGRHMNRRLLTAVGATALLLGSALPAATIAASPDASRHFTRLDVSKIDPQIGPAILANKPVTVMVQLKAAAATTGKASKAKQIATARVLKASQDALKPAIGRAGGTVLGQYQYAYNGIKVRIAGRGVAALAALPGVAAVRGVAVYTVDNVNSVPFIGAPAAWDDLGVTGDGQTIAVIDTGIDYTHANFGGAGTVAAFEDNDSTVIEPGSFPTDKVIAGWDFAGNGYDATGDNGSVTPTPDPDPLDCFGHGSHVSGTAAGQGVLADGSTFAGPYTSAIYGNNTFAIGPGVAPQAKLVDLKVFGCEGSTDLVVDALNWVADYNAHHADAIDVVNMSLGSSFGRNDNPDAVATNTLVGAGVVVVASAGNSGPNAYITGSPAAATQAISVAAEDTLASFPGAVIDFASATDITNANNQNAWPGLPVGGTLKVVYSAPGVVSLGCTAADYGTLPANTVVAIQRGVCPFVDKGAAAEAAGAIGIIDINRDDITNPAELPTFIGYNPEIFDIPMIGVGNGSKAGIIAADGQAVTLQPGGTLANPTYKQLASFSSGGPRNGDSAAKPDVTAPGSSIVSTLVGSGSKGTTLSGTSMASPHVAGVAALVHAANPGWTPLAIKSAIVGTASAAAADITPYNVRTAGAGAVKARRAVDTVAYATTPDDTASLSFGYDPAGAAYSETRAITLHNTSASDITYNLAGASIVSVSPASVTVPAGSTATVNATASLTAAQLGTQPTTSVLLGGAPWGGVNTFRGAVVATPTTSGAGIYSLRVPFMAVPRALSNVTAGARSAYTTSGGIASASIPLTNTGVHTGYADVYAWGMSDPQDLGSSSTATNDIRAVGVQTFAAEGLTGVADPNDRALVFAVNTWGQWSTAVSNEFDIAIYGANKHKPDYFVVGVDFGIVTAGAFDGRMASFVFDAAGNLVDAWVADGPANGSTVLLPILASDIGQTTNNTRFSYAITGFSVEDSSLVDSVAGQAEFNTFHPALTTGQFVAVPAGGSGTIPVAVDKGILATAPAKGWLVVTLDDANGAAQADTVGIGTP